MGAGRLGSRRLERVNLKLGGGDPRDWRKGGRGAALAGLGARSGRTLGRDLWRSIKVG